METTLQSLPFAAGHELGKEALAVIDRAVREENPDAFTLLRTVITKEGISPFVRAALARAMRAFPNQEAEQLLLSILVEDDNLVVRSRVCDALMQIGSEGALRPLEAFAASAPESARSIAGFAHAVIAHRLGIASSYLAQPYQANQLPLVGVASSFESRPPFPNALQGSDRGSRQRSIQAWRLFGGRR